MGNGLEKVPPTLPALLHPGWLTTIGRDLSQCSRNKKAKKYLGTLPHGTSVHLLTWTTQVDFINIPLVAFELARYKINIAALSETRLAGKGELTEKSSGYSFFWSGRALDDKHKPGVGYAIKTSLVGELASPKGVNDHFMTMRFPLYHGKSLLPLSAFMHSPWPTRMRQKTSSMKTLKMLTPL